MSLLDRIARNRPGFDGLPHAIWMRLFAGVFLTFAPVMVLSVSTLAPQRSASSLTFWMIVSGAVGLLWAITFMLRSKGLVVTLIIVQLTVVVMFAANWPPGFGIGRPRPSVWSFVIMACVGGGYALIVWFLRIQGAMRERAQAELDLARRIHSTLVPAISLKTGSVEVHGRSVPSSEMGGDLIDVVSHKTGVDIYLADVSGTVSVPESSWRWSRARSGRVFSPTLRSIVSSPT